MTKTEENLKIAFAGESQARNKYTYFAKVAKKEGYDYISKIFEETAENEREHAKNEFKLLKGISNTENNLMASIEGEEYEISTMYPQFIKDAKEEGKEEVATLFQEILKAEEAHRDRFKKLLELVKSKKVYERENPIDWKCSKCGKLENGKMPPETCPCCAHPKNYFEPICLCFD